LDVKTYGLVSLLAFGSLVLTSHRCSAQAWTNTSLSATQRAELLVSAMTVDEKIAMVHGVEGAYVGNVTNNARLGIPALRLEDGPAGVAAWGPPGIVYTSPITLVTAFPAPVAMTATWDPALMRACGLHMAVEERGKGVHLQNTPMLNMVRAPQAGRAFEVFGEDPFLASAMAAAQVQGVQSQGVIANAKSFVNNDQETDRDGASSDVDARVQHELYFPPFRAAVRAGVGAFMTAYNRVNGTYTSEAELLGVVLKKQWGFDGFVMTDWWAKFSAVAAANNGLDLEMPANNHFDAELKAAVQDGAVPAAQLDEMVKRILTPMFRMRIFDDPTTGNLSANMLDVNRALFVRSAAAQGTVLLKNAADTLPLNTNSLHSIAVIGPAGHAAPHSVGGGSGSVFLTYEITPLVGISNRVGASVSVRYEQGDGGRIAQAVQLAQQSDVAIVFAGLRTTEGEDRTSLSLPGDSDALISAVAAANPRTVVVLNVGGPVLMPWLERAASVLVAWYPGQENGNSIASILFGDVNPSGRLPITFPRSESELPTATPAQFPGINGHVCYSEGLLMGYRWYDANDAQPLFPFGHGLSYTTFSYSNLTVSVPSAAGQVEVAFDVRNTGNRAGSEVAQLYLGFPASAAEPPRQLKGFQKTALNAGETKRVAFTLTQEELSYWDVTLRGWKVPAGSFQIMAGPSSRDLRLTNTFTIASEIAASDMANAALNRRATASTMQTTNNPPSAAVDGNPTTRWSSALFSDPQWIAVDLGAVRDIGRVRLNWESAYARSYSIQVSADNTNWTEVVSVTDGDGGLDDLPVNGRGRYVRMYGTQRGTAWGYSLWDFEVYSPPQRPFGDAPHALPARIEAEDYDTGGEGVAFHDATPSNEGGAYRTDAVDIVETSDTGGGYSVGWFASGEWLEYTVGLPETAAIYHVGLRAASVGGGRLRLRLNGTIIGSIPVPDTGDSQTWQTLILPSVAVSGGTGSQALRVEALGGTVSLNWIDFSLAAVCTPTNLARVAGALASSAQDTNYAARAASDGNPCTRWASAPFSDPQWLQVDLGSESDVCRIHLDWESAYARSYQVQLSLDGSSWTDAYATNQGDGGLDDLPVSGVARYVRLFCSQRGMWWGYSLWDMQVYALKPPPRLDLSVAGDDLHLTWPLAPSFRLQRTHSLANPDWQDVLGTGNSESYSERIVATNSFYRMKAH
jgi:beta-glucosidase